MGNRSFTVVILLLGALVLAFNSLYIVRETERAVLLKFGEIVDPDVAVGLHVKTPFVHMVRKFERRILTLDAPTQRFLTIEKKPLDVDFYAKWRVIDTQKFYTATNGEEIRAEGLLAQRINTGLRNKFGERTFHEVVSGERDLLMTDLTRDLNEITTSEFGIQLVDVRVKRIDLPSQVSQSVFDRMKLSVSAKRVSIALLVANWLRKFVRRLIVSALLSVQTPTVTRKYCAVRAMH